MAQRATLAIDESTTDGRFESGPALVAGGERGVATTLGDLFTALQDVTDDDRLVTAVVSDLMARGALKRPGTESVH